MEDLNNATSVLGSRTVAQTYGEARSKAPFTSVGAIHLYSYTDAGDGNWIKLCRLLVLYGANRLRRDNHDGMDNPQYFISLYYVLGKIGGTVSMTATSLLVYEIRNKAMENPELPEGWTKGNSFQGDVNDSETLYHDLLMVWAVMVEGGDVPIVEATNLDMHNWTNTDIDYWQTYRLRDKTYGPWVRGSNNDYIHIN